MRADWTALPKVFLAAALIAGETLAFVFSGFAGLWAWAALSAVLSICFGLGWRIRCGFHIAVFIAGAALAWHAEFKRIALDEYSKMRSDAGCPPSFLLKVDGDVLCRRGRGKCRMVSFASSLSGMPIKVVAQFPEYAHTPRNGEVWRCAGWLSRRRNCSNRYAGRTLWVTDCRFIEKVADYGGWSGDVIYRNLSERLLSSVGTGVEWSRELQSFCGAMLLGRRDGIPYKRLAVFAAAGSIHVFAISGLHVMLIAGLLNGLLKALGMSRRVRAAWAIPMLAGYVMLIGAPPSAVRAGVMVSLYLGAHLFGRKPDSIAAWSSAAIVVFGASPEMVLNVGCVLSFSVMLGIVLWIRWSGQFASPLDGLLKLAAIEAALGCDRRKKIILKVHGKLQWILGMLGISFAAWVAGAPISAVVFGRLSPGGMLLNLAVVPLAGMAVAFIAFGTVAAFVLPYLGVFFNNLAALSIYLMSWLSDMLVKIPYSSVNTLPWSWLDCIMWYAAWFFLFALLARHLPRREFIYIREWEKGDD